jgi:hypothetical protein
MKLVEARTKCNSRRGLGAAPDIEPGRAKSRPVSSSMAGDPWHQSGVHHPDHGQARINQRVLRSSRRGRYGSTSSRRAARGLPLVLSPIPPLVLSLSKDERDGLRVHPELGARHFLGNAHTTTGLNALDCPFRAKWAASV